MKPNHLQDLISSGISDEIINLNFRSVEGDDIYEDLAIGCTERRNDGRLPNSWLKLYKHCEDGGWWSNGISLADFKEIEWGCFKPDSPRIDKEKNKPIKYEHPKGVPTDIFILKVGQSACTLINETWSANLEPGTFWQGVIDNKELPVFITEGAKKAACLLSNGFVSVALPGIWNGCKKEGEGHILHPSLMPLVGRTFYIAFDQDTKPETKRQVTGAANRLKKVLESLDSPCYSLAWIPAFKGCDDLIVAKGADYFRAVVDKAIKKAEVKTSTPLKEPQGWDDNDGQKIAVETSTPLTEPVPNNRFFYGGTKPLKEHELLDLLRGLGDRLTFDELTSTILLDGRKLTIGKEIKFWFLETFGETAEKGDIADCLTLCAKKNSFNPVKRYLSGLKCPGIPIDNLAERYFGRPEKIYSRMVEMWLISAIARALTPVDPSMYAEVSEDAIGTKVDYTLILQSDQGKYKSTFFDVLGGRWFSDSVKDIESKDSLMIVHSAWIIELSELDRITSKKQAGSIKHWLTQKTDSYRKPYAAEVEQNLPRRCVFCGTVNPSRFLVDDENRRFWILPVAEDSEGIDINLLQTERDGIWRSAYRAYHIGGLIPLLSLLVKTELSKIHDFFFLALLLMNPHQQWWPTPEEMIEIKRLNQNFQEIDAWEDEIAHWIKGREYVSSYEILSDLLKFEPNQIKKPEQMRIMRILTGLGWKKDARRDYIQDDGSKKVRNVRLNPLIENNSSSKDSKVGKEPTEQDFQDLEVGNSTSSSGNSQSTSYQPTGRNSNLHGFWKWEEKTGHKLTPETWVSASNLIPIKLLAPAPFGNAWVGTTESGEEVQISEAEIIQLCVYEG